MSFPFAGQRILSERTSRANLNPTVFSQCFEASRDFIYTSKLAGLHEDCPLAVASLLPDIIFAGELAPLIRPELG
jgi:hypothetical protein